MNGHVVYEALFFLFNICELLSVHGPTVHQFVRFNSPCQMNNSIFQSVNSNSLIHCALLCDANSFGPCGRFVWATDTLTCMLHSNNYYTGVSSITVMSQIGWIIFGRKNTDCFARGFDFDSETLTCIRFRDTRQVTWYEAKSLCREDGGDLISLTSTGKIEFAMNYVHCMKKVWIGLQGHKWATGDDFDNHTHGLGFQLNNYDTQFSNDTAMNCSIIVPSSQYVFQDNSCNMRTRTKILCEMIIT